MDNKEKLYTLRWHLAEISRYTTDPKLDSLALEAMKINSELLGEDLPEEFKGPVVVRPNPETPQTSGVKYPLNQKALWYPKALVKKDKPMRSRGNYSTKSGMPLGAVVHFTAGNFSAKPPQNAINTISYAQEQGYLFLCLDVDGTMAQTNPMNQYGYHAGDSSWIFNGKKCSGVSNYLVGIEINNPGRLEKLNGKFYSWFDKKNPIDAKLVRTFTKDEDNIQPGHYLAYTKEQEKSLVDFFIWMKANNPTEFNFDYVLGHDEVAGNTTYADESKGMGLSIDRKNDPGGALSMSMPKFREFLKAEFKKIYGTI